MEAELKHAEGRISAPGCGAFQHTLKYHGKTGDKAVATATVMSGGTRFVTLQGCRFDVNR